jgi:hypothetical protein
MLSRDRKLTTMEIIEARPISITIGPVHMKGYLFVAAPPVETYVEGQVDVLGLIQADIRMLVTEQDASVDLTIHELIYTFSIHFDMPTSALLCQLQPKDAEAEADWHLLSAVPG